MVDGENITRILREAVRDGLIVPAIDRNWRGSEGVSKRYAPQAWPKRAPDPKPIVYAPRNGRLHPIDPYRNVLDENYDAPVVAKTVVSASNAGGSGGAFDWLGTAEAVAGTVFGGADVDDDSGGQRMLEGFGDPNGDVGTLLGDAQPFEYVQDDLGAPVDDLAATTTNPDHAARMLGYDRDTFGDMIHAMKDQNGLRGDNNVVWHDNGDVYYRGIYLDNMYNY